MLATNGQNSQPNGRENSQRFKITKDLKSAQMTIDMLLMLKEKTKGNLTDTEAKLLEDTISNLQMNYADEVSKGDTSKAEKQDKVEDKKEEKTK